MDYGRQVYDHWQQRANDCYTDSEKKVQGTITDNNSVTPTAAHCLSITGMYEKFCFLNVDINVHVYY